MFIFKVQAYCILLLQAVTELVVSAEDEASRRTE